MFNSSLGKKYWMAVTGAFLMFFVVAHLLGNLQMFLGPDWMNGYAEHLEESPLLLWPMRVLLGCALVLHMVLGLWLGVENARSRPKRYAVNATVQASLTSRMMVFLGLAIFCFIIFHLLHFTFDLVNPAITDYKDAKGRNDVYSMVVLAFQDPRIVGIYLVAIFFLSAHLRHGGYSFLQSLGLLRESQLPKAKVFALLFAILIFLGYGSIAVASYTGYLKPLNGGIHGA